MEGRGKEKVNWGNNTSGKKNKVWDTVDQESGVFFVLNSGMSDQAEWWIIEILPASAERVARDGGEVSQDSWWDGEENAHSDTMACMQHSVGGIFYLKNRKKLSSLLQWKTIESTGRGKSRKYGRWLWSLEILWWQEIETVKTISTTFWEYDFKFSENTHDLPLAYTGLDSSQYKLITGWSLLVSSLWQNRNQQHWHLIWPNANKREHHILLHLLKFQAQLQKRLW